MNRVRAEAEALRELLARRADEAAAATVEAGGEVSAERLDAVARLAKLVEMREAAAAAARSRWTVPLVAIGTLVVVTALLFMHVSSTQVEMDLTVSEVAFVLPSVEVLSNAANVNAVGVSGLTAIEIPSSGATSDRAAATDLLVTALPIGPSPEGTVGINPITVPAGARVAFRTLEGAGRYQLIVRGLVAPLGLAVNGPVQIVVPPDRNERRTYAYPRRLTVEPDSAEVRFDLTLDAQARGGLLWAPLPVDSLTFSRTDEFQDAGQTVVRQVSTIRSGTVYFESIGGRSQALRAGEVLAFGQSSGEIHEWRFDTSGIVLRFHGSVRGMTTGSRGARRSLMPTALESLREQHGVSLLWGTTAYIVGLVLTVMGWWRRRP